MAGKKLRKPTSPKTKPATREARLSRLKKTAKCVCGAAGAVFCLGYVSLLIAGCTIADALIFPVRPAAYTADEPNLIRLPLQGGGEVPALWLENKNAKYTVIYFHGNACDIGNMRPITENIRRQGYSVLSVEYPGYGIAAGKPSEDGCCRAADAGYAYLQTVRGVPENRIVIYGFSLGTGVATDLAARKNAGALILESPFLSTFRVMTRIKLLPFDKFDNYAKIENVKCPVFVAHGTADKTIPFRQGKTLYEAATGARRKQFYTFENGGHGNHNAAAWKDYTDAIKQFLAASE